MKKVVGFIAAIVVATILLNGCAPTKNWPATTTSTVLGGGYAALVGCLVGTVLFQNCETAALVGAAIGLPIFTYLGYRADQTPVQRCYWRLRYHPTKKSYDYEHLYCDGAVTQIRPDQPPHIPFPPPSGQEIGQRATARIKLSMQTHPLPPNTPGVQHIVVK
jgi:hypothetical protein